MHDLRWNPCDVPSLERQASFVRVVEYESYGVDVLVMHEPQTGRFFRLTTEIETGTIPRSQLGWTCTTGYRITVEPLDRG